MAPLMTLLPLLLMYVAFQLRKLAPQNHWLHTPAGAFVVSLVAGALDALGHGFQQGGVTKAVAASSIIAFVGSLLSQANPSVDMQTGLIKAPTPPAALPPPPRAGSSSGRVGLIVLMVIGALGLAAAIANAGCAYCDQRNADGELAHAQEQKCKDWQRAKAEAYCAGKGVAILVQQVLPSVGLALLGGNSSAALDALVAGLKANGYGDAESVLSCAVHAWDVNAPAAPASATPKALDLPSPMLSKFDLAAAHLAAGAWLAQHPLKVQ